MTALGFPGREAALSRFRRVLDAGGLGQAYLFVGPEGSGKEATALEIARLAECRREPPCAEGEPCESCRKALSYQHPDVRWFGPAPATIGEAEIGALLEAKRDDPFHQPPWAAVARLTIGHPDDPHPLSVRALRRFLRRQAFQGRWKVAVVADAQRLTDEAANALLKTLEEPPGATLLFLLATHRTGLLPTIVSRCQVVGFEPWGQEELAGMLVERRGCDPATAAAVSRLADGNARRAVALLQPEAMVLGAWAARLVDRIHAGDLATVQVAAEELHAGRLPDDLVEAAGPPAPPPAREAAARRDRTVRLCESLGLYYSELLNCRERAAGWSPRLPEPERLRELAAGRRTATLLEDIRRLDDAKGEIDRNANIGLVMAVLLRSLIDDVERDRRPGAPPP